MYKTESVDGEYCSFHAYDNGLSFPACEFIDCFSVICEAAFLGVNSGKVVKCFFESAMKLFVFCEDLISFSTKDGA